MATNRRARGKRGDSSPPRARIVRHSAEARRAQLLDTAADLVVNRGFDAVTMEAVGEAAGASKTLGYAYFTNVDELILELWEREVGRLVDRVLEAATDAASLEDKLRAVVHAYWDTVEERGQLLGSLQAGLAARRVDTSQSPRTLEFVRWLTAAIREEYRISGRDALSLAIAVSSIPTLFSDQIQVLDGDRERLEPISTEFAIGGLMRALEALSVPASAQPRLMRRSRRA